MTAFAIPAQFAHSTVTPVMNMDSVVAENHLERICGGESVVHVYKDDTRAWWDSVDDDMVYGAIAKKEFQAFVRLITAIA